MVSFCFELPLKNIIGKLVAGPHNCQSLLLNLGYLFSVSEIAIDAYATGFQSEMVCCSSTAPNLCKEVSAEILAVAVGLYNVSAVGWVSSFLAWLNELVLLWTPDS